MRFALCRRPAVALLVAIVFLLSPAFSNSAIAGPSFIANRWMCGVGGLGEYKCYDKETGTTFTCFKDGPDWTCHPDGMRPGSTANAVQLERDLASNPDQLPTPAIAISPREQVTDEYCYAFYTITVPRSALPSTLEIDYGDGMSEQFAIDAGSGTATFNVAHAFPYYSQAVDEVLPQSASVVELGIYNAAVTRHLADGAAIVDPGPPEDA